MQCLPVPVSLTESVATATGSLPTVGGSVVTVRGRFLGLISSAVSVVYTGGSLGMRQRTFTIPAGNCSVVNPGSVLQCTCLPGVGANYTFVVIVGGGVSQSSATTLSYAPPFITSVAGPAAVGGPAVGGVEIVLHGVSYPH
jgi:hypothetical protein